MSSSVLSEEQRELLRAVAVALIPGDATSPPAADVPELDGLLTDAATALGVGFGALRDAVGRLPDPIDWTTLARFAQEDRVAFDQVATVASGAYFMSTAVLASLGYPTGPRTAAPFDLAAEELGSGILDPVMAAGSRLRAVGGAGA